MSSSGHAKRGAHGQKSWLDRSLSLFTEVRAGEGVTALLLAANVFYLLAFYSVLKIVRDSLILSGGGRRRRELRGCGQALLLLDLRAGLRRVRVAREPRAAHLPGSRCSSPPTS